MTGLHGHGLKVPKHTFRMGKRMYRWIAATALVVTAAAHAADDTRPFPLGDSGYLCKVPAYPVAALRSGAQGTTTLSIKVDDTGAVVAAEVVARSGDTPEHVLLDRSAVRFALTCRYAGASPPEPGRYTYDQQWIIE